MKRLARVLGPVLGLALAASCGERDDGAERARAASPRVLWADGFDGPRGAPPDHRTWRAMTGGRWAEGKELQSYTARPANVALDGRGHLVLTARAERYAGEDGVARDYTSARIETAGLRHIRHGRVEARMRVPRGRGLLAAFWALGARTPDVGWPAGGEIDVVEVLGSAPRVAHASLHMADPLGGHLRMTRATRSRRALSDRFHVYAADWRPGRVTMSIDGRPYATFTRDDLGPDVEWPFDTHFSLVLSLAVGNPWTGPPDGSTRWPASLVVDWVRVRDLS